MADNPSTTLELAKAAAVYYTFLGAASGAIITAIVSILIHLSGARKRKEELKRARGETMRELIGIKDAFRTADNALREPLATYNRLLDDIPNHKDELGRTRDTLCGKLAEAVSKYTDLLDYECDVFKNDRERAGNLVEESTEVLRIWTRLVSALNRSDVLLALGKQPLKFNHRDLSGKRPAEHIGRNRRLGVGLANGEIKPDASGGGGGREVLPRWRR
ncbi:MAG: hypothetical protein WBL72_17575, partial [Thermoguttaceae bacterium]